MFVCQDCWAFKKKQKTHYLPTTCDLGDFSNIWESFFEGFILVLFVIPISHAIPFQGPAGNVVIVHINYVQRVTWMQCYRTHIKPPKAMKGLI